MWKVAESVDCVHACWTSELFKVESFGVYLGTSVVFGYAWFSVMKFCECVVRFLCVRVFCRGGLVGVFSKV